MPFQHPPIPIRKLRPGFLIATGMSTFFRLAKYGNCKNTESKFISVFNVIKEKNGNKNRNSLVQSRRKRKNEFRFPVQWENGKRKWKFEFRFPLIWAENEHRSWNSIFLHRRKTVDTKGHIKWTLQPFYFTTLDFFVF